MPDTYQLALDICRTAAAEAGVRFLDMTDAFLEAYEAERILPHGFSNTAPGAGHMNVNGNRIVAEALCAEILEQEAAK